MSQPHAIQQARASCSSRRGFSEDVQLAATAPHNRLGIACAPAENNFQSAPCILEHFFHYPPGFEEMDGATMAASMQKVLPFNQCRQRKRDADWPTVEPYLRRNGVRDMADVMSLLGKRVVTMIGASIVRQTLAAMQCALESQTAGGRHQRQA